jgi:hypothetical protein
MDMKLVKRVLFVGLVAVAAVAAYKMISNKFPQLPKLL